MHLAAMASSEELVKMLLEFGFAKDVKNKVLHHPVIFSSSTKPHSPSQNLVETPP